MSASTAIGMVSESLRNLLVQEMTLTPPVAVTVLTPDETGGDRRVNLFLYRIVENTSLKNLDWQVRPGGVPRIAPPPLSLNLFYLMTAYAQNDPLTGNSTAHELLGEAMRVFHEHAIVPRDVLVQGLHDAAEQIKIMPTPLEPDELGRLWSTFSQPFRLSVLYEVSAVQLEPLHDRPMSSRVQRAGVPDVHASFHPPVVEQLDPLRGPVGTSITARGRNLAGWPVSLSIDGNRIVDASAPVGDAVTATIPTELSPGFHEIQVDVASLHRRVFFFEVSA
jgi:hypothetical protein